MGSSRLGSILVSEGLLTERDRSMIQRSSGTNAFAFAKTVLAMGLLDDDELASLLAARTKFQIAPKNILEHINLDALECLPQEVISFLDVLPIRLEQKTLIVAVPDPLDQDVTKQLQFFTGLKIKPVIAPLSQIRAGLERLQTDFKNHSSDFESFIENHASNASQRLTLGRAGAITTPGTRSTDPSEPTKATETPLEVANSQAALASVADDDFPDALESEEALSEDLVATEDNDIPEVDPLFEVEPQEEIQAAEAATGDDLLVSNIEAQEPVPSNNLDAIDVNDVDFGEDNNFGDLGGDATPPATEAAEAAEGDDLLALSDDENNLLSMDESNEDKPTTEDLNDIDASMQQSFADDDLLMSEPPAPQAKTGADDLLNLSEGSEELATPNASDDLGDLSDLESAPADEGNTSGIVETTADDPLADLDASDDLSATTVNDSSDELADLETSAEHDEPAARGDDLSSEDLANIETAPDLSDLEATATDDLSSLESATDELSADLSTEDLSATALEEDIPLTESSSDMLEEIPVTILPHAALAAVNASLLRISAISKPGQYIDRLQESLENIFPQGRLYEVHDTKLDTLHQWGMNRADDRQRFTFGDAEITEMLQSLEPNHLIVLPQLADKAGPGYAFCGSAFGSADDHHFVGIFAIAAHELENGVFNEVFTGMLKTLATRSVA